MHGPITPIPVQGFVNGAIYCSALSGKSAAMLKWRAVFLSGSQRSAIIKKKPRDSHLETLQHYGVIRFEDIKSYS